MMRRTRLFVVVAALGAMACDEGAEPATGPSFGMSGVAGHTNGEGTFNIGAPGADIAFEITALSRASGGATGNVYYVADLTDFGLGTIEMRFDVTCLSRDPDLGRAWIGGVVTYNNSTNPAFATEARRQVGRDVWFRIEDNGNGSSGTLDRSTQLGFEGSGGILTSTQYCQAQIWPAAPLHEVTTGNISLR